MHYYFEGNSFTFVKNLIQSLRMTVLRRLGNIAAFELLSLSFAPIVCYFFIVCNINYSICKQLLHQRLLLFPSSPGALAIGITCNFVNNNTPEEAEVPEVPGISYQFNPSFFDKLNEKHGVKLENIVYYKNETHYFVMTALKSSLLEQGVILQVCHPPRSSPPWFIFTPG